MARKANSFVGIRIPMQVKDRWEKQAEQEHRSLSNWILHRIEGGSGVGSPSSTRPGHSKKEMVG